MPVVVLLDWIVDQSGVTIRFKHALLWLCIPIVYVVYTLIRGAIVGWYPYPFLNPTHQDQGYGTIFVMMVLLSLLVVIGVRLVWAVQF